MNKCHMKLPKLQSIKKQQSKRIQISFLSKSMVVLFASISMLSLNTVAADNVSDTQLDYALLKMSDAEALELIRNNPNLLSATRKFKSCTSLQLQSARLACFDEVASTGHESEYTRDKKQLDLGGMIKSTLSGNPKIVIFDPNTINNAANTMTSENEVIDNNQVTQDKSIPVKTNKTHISDMMNIIGVSELKKSSINPITGNKRLFDNKTASFSQKPTKFDKQNLSADVAEKESHQLDEQLNAEVTVKNSVQDDVSHADISPLSLMYDLDKNDEVGTWKPRPHNPMYIIPLFMHGNPNRSPSTPYQDEITYTQNDYRSSELKFQTSFKSKVAQDLFGTDADLWMGYTQQSHWQVYNEDNSRPFRAHDYMPELFLTQPVYTELPLGGKFRMLGGGFMHHSNGEDDPQSRSWNRIYLMGGAEWDNTWGKVTVMPRIWKRLSAKSSQMKDENSDIEEYYGYGDMKIFYDMDSGQSLSSTFRLNPSSGKGAVEFDYIYPMDNNVNLFLNVFHGYGESLIDYNHNDTTFGVGIMLNDWRGL